MRPDKPKPSARDGDAGLQDARLLEGLLQWVCRSTTSYEFGKPEADAIARALTKKHRLTYAMSRPDIYYRAFVVSLPFDDNGVSCRENEATMLMYVHFSVRGPFYAVTHSQRMLHADEVPQSWRELSESDPVPTKIVELRGEFAMTLRRHGFVEIERRYHQIPIVDGARPLFGGEPTVWTTLFSE